CYYSILCSITTSSFFFFFFFQAEDGIRDATVTGVQTCALPILSDAALGDLAAGRTARDAAHQQRAHLDGCLTCLKRFTGLQAARSEERRVGKECKYGWWA